MKLTLRYFPSAAQGRRKSIVSDDIELPFKAHRAHTVADLFLQLPHLESKYKVCRGTTFLTKDDVIEPYESLNAIPID